MLSNQLLDSLDSIVSELGPIIVSEQISEIDQLRLKKLLQTLKSTNSDLSEEKLRKLLQDLRLALEELETFTSHKINLLNFLNDISPK